MISLERALRRAARRSPGSAASASLARLHEQRQALLDIPVPEPIATPGPIIISSGELWCRHCGHIVISRRFGKSLACGPSEQCCAHPDPVPAASVLRPGEYIRNT